MDGWAAIDVRVVIAVFSGIALTQTTSFQEMAFAQARACLQQGMTWYASFKRHWNYPPNLELQSAVRPDLQALKAAQEKLEQRVIRIATFGLVSRGKSAVINALFGQKMMATGALHGVTQWPKSIRWLPMSDKIQVELIDTPGLDEIEGQHRAAMAQEVASQADLILFVVAGDVTRTEYQALQSLCQIHQPLIVVFNKIDLYPERDRQSIYEQLQHLAQGEQEKHREQGEGKESRDFKAPPWGLRPEDIVLVAAEPQSIPVRVEWPDGRVSETQETPAPQIDALKQKLLALLNGDGRSLLVLNALRQAREAEQRIAHKTVTIRQPEAEAIIWKFARYKALVVALNPLAIFDVMGGIGADLMLIRTLAKLYGLPMTSYEAGRLWKKILTSTGGVVFADVISSALWGVGKSATAATSLFNGPGALTAYASMAALQGAIAGYGSYLVGQAAQVYLEQGCTWGPLGPSQVIQELLARADDASALARFREALTQGSTDNLWNQG